MISKNKWILIVDDEIEILNSVRELLMITFGEDSLKIVEATNGIDATVKVKNQKFDCIISDLKMPKKEGDAFIASVRQNLFNADTPVIVLTAFPNDKITNEHRFVYLIEKPFTHDQLTSLVSTQLKLGGGGDRLAADMVNRILAASKSFLETVYPESEFSLDTPQAKLAGEPPQCDYVSQLSFFEEGVHNSFSILLTKEFLKNLSEKRNLSNKKPIEVASALGQSILKYSMSNGKVRGLKYQIKNMKAEEAKPLLLPKKGIRIPMAFEDLTFEILACAEKSRKIAA
jgi:CheY-like chemotaxis protein